MAGLGLTAMDAIGGYQQGVEWGQRQQEIGRQKKMRDDQDAANAAFGQVLKDGEAKFNSEWDAANPAQPAGLDSPAQPRQRPAYKPDESTLFRAAEARGLALAKAGDVDGYFKNDAAVAPMRIKARAAALQRFQADGNIENLVRTAHATMFDGQDLESIETVKGGEGGQLGAPSGPDMVRIKFKGGQTQMLKPEDVVNRVKASLTDPVTFAQKEAELNYQGALQRLKTAGQKEVDNNKHKNSVDLEANKAGHKKDELGLQAANAQTLAGINNERALQVANIGAGATLGAARINADSRVSAAAKNPRGEDGMTVSERLRQAQQQAVSARDLVNALNQQLKTPGLRSDDRKRILGELTDATNSLREINAGIGKLMVASPGLGDASPSPGPGPGPGPGLGDAVASGGRPPAAPRPSAGPRPNSLGLDSSAAPTPAPRQSIPTLPTGSKQIGTSGGRPVYQTPDGRKFIGG